MTRVFATRIQPSLLVVHILIAALTLQALAVPIPKSDAAAKSDSDTGARWGIGLASGVVGFGGGVIGAKLLQRPETAPSSNAAAPFQILPSDSSHNRWGETGAQADGGATSGSLTIHKLFVGESQIHTEGQLTAAAKAAQEDGVSNMVIKNGNKRLQLNL
jgi:hypothetical protein